MSAFIIALFILTYRVHPLQPDYQLMARAQVRTQDICKGDFSHEKWLQNWNPQQFKHIGENLALGYTDATSTMQGFMTSPSHRENIEATKFQSVGIWATKCFGVIVVAEEFGGN